MCNAALFVIEICTLGFVQYKIMVVAVVWSVESLAARIRFPVGSEILISILGLCVCPLCCPVLSPAVALTMC